MNLVIENVNEDFAKAIKSMAKIANAKVKIKKSNQAEEWKKEADEIIRLYKEGKIKAYKSADEMAKAMMNEV